MWAVRERIRGWLEQLEGWCCHFSEMGKAAEALGENQEFVSGQLNQGGVIRAYMAPKTMSLDEAPWGMNVDKWSNNWVLRHSNAQRSRRRRQQPTLRRTSEVRERVSWKTSEARTPGRREMKWINMSESALLWPWPELSRWGGGDEAWSWKDRRREAWEGLETSTDNSFRGFCCKGERRHGWELERDVSLEGSKGECFYFWY